jgi:hypothetical protein
LRTLSDFFSEDGEDMIDHEILILRSRKRECNQLLAYQQRQGSGTQCLSTNNGSQKQPKKHGRLIHLGRVLQLPYLQNNLFGRNNLRKMDTWIAGYLQKKKTGAQCDDLSYK